MFRVYFRWENWSILMRKCIVTATNRWLLQYIIVEYFLTFIPCNQEGNSQQFMFHVHELNFRVVLRFFRKKANSISYQNFNASSLDPVRPYQTDWFILLTPQARFPRCLQEACGTRLDTPKGASKKYVRSELPLFGPPSPPYTPVRYALRLTPSPPVQAYAKSFS